MSQLDSFYQVREWFDFVQEVEHDGGPAGAQTLIKAASAVVIKNPFAGSWVEDLSPLTKPSATIGTALGGRAAALLRGRAVESYGKGGVSGTAGEQEHVIACITTVFGDALREAVGGGAAWISSATKSGAAGTTIDIPLAFKDEVYVRSHYDAITICVPDAPRPDELLIVAAVASGPRIHERNGGLTRDEARARKP